MRIAVARRKTGQSIGHGKQVGAEAKIRHFAAGARSLDIERHPKRKHVTLALAAALILKQAVRALDDVANMFIRQVKKMLRKFYARHSPLVRHPNFGSIELP